MLATSMNTVDLLIAAGSIGWQAIQRFRHAEETKGSVITLVAAVGIIINALSALLFFRRRNKDLNVIGAYLHPATDVPVFAGVVIT